MIKRTLTLNQVKDGINKRKESPVEVTINLGRNKFVKYSGVLTGVYPALFTVTPSDKSFKGKTSYSYSEFLCGRVKLKFPETIPPTTGA